MFTTYKSYKVPINLKDGSERWHIVERDLGTPWLLAQTKDAEGLGRTFLLHDPNQLVGLARTKGIGKLIRAYIVLPPHRSPIGDWTFLRIRCVEMEHDTRPDGIDRVLFTVLDGKKFGGFPVAPIKPRQVPTELVVELGVEVVDVDESGWADES